MSVSYRPIGRITTSIWCVKGSLTGSCGEPGALKGARRVREAARENGTATTTVTASRADFHRPSPPPITQFIDEQRAVGHGVESICAVLREQGVPVTPRTYRSVAPRTYRSWRTSPPAARVVSDAQRVDKLRSLRTGTGSAGAAHCPRGSTGAAR
jgi:putative transposase